jgi:RNA polymerase sigma-70 factor (ECF subfamily)
VRKFGRSRSRAQAAYVPGGATLSSFETLILPHLDGAYNLARFLTRDPALSEDVVQAAVLRAFQSFAQFRGDSPRAWLLAIVRNCCRSALSAQNASGLRLVHEDSAASDAEAITDNPEEALIRAWDAAMVRDLVESLPEPFREAIVLRDLEELSYREIAQVTGVAMGTVMSRIARGRGMLAEQISEGSRAADQTRNSQ